VDLRTLALCAGIGGLERGVALATDVRVVGAVERQAFAAAVLVDRMEEAALVAAADGRDPDACRYPIWDDLATFDGRPWAGSVDLIVAGYPCQPESGAGKRLGESDERWLWHEVFRIVREVRPAYLFVENVAAHLSGTFRRVLGDVSSLGWVAEWDCIPAAAVGAPHLRDRFFMLAADPDRLAVRVESERDQRRGRDARASERRDAVAVLDGGERVVADADMCPCGGRSKNKGGRSTRRDAANGDGDRVGAPPLADGARHEGGRIEESGEQREDAAGGAGCYWWSEPAPEPSFRRVAHGAADRLDGDSDVAALEDYWADRIHALGNAVVPQAAERAWNVLYARLVGGLT